MSAPSTLHAPVARPATATSGSSSVARRRAALVLSWVAVATIVLTSAVSLLVDGVYLDGPEAEAAQQAADLVLLVVGAPLLAATAIAVARGSVRAQPLWVGTLAFVLYASVYAVFVPTFNDLFLPQVALFATVLAALPLATSTVDADAVAARFDHRTPVRLAGGLLVLVGVGTVVMWGRGALDFIASGTVPEDVLPAPEWRARLGAAVDLAILAPAVTVGGALLLRRRAWGYVTATAAAMLLWLPQLTYAATAVLQDRAGIPDVAATDPTPWISMVVLAVPLALLLAGMRGGAAPPAGRPSP